MIPPPPFVNGPGDGLALAAIGVVIAFIGSVMTSGAILAAVDAIYTRNDLDLLLSSPVSPWRDAGGALLRHRGRRAAALCGPARAAAALDGGLLLAAVAVGDRLARSRWRLPRPASRC